MQAGRTPVPQAQMAVAVAPVVPMAQPVIPMAQPVMVETAMVSATIVDDGQAKVREAEQRARDAEAAMRIQEAELRAHAAEEAMALQKRLAELEKAVRDAMPSWLGGWSDEKTAVLRTVIAQAEAAAPPTGSSLHSTLLQAKEALLAKEAEERTTQPAPKKSFSLRKSSSSHDVKKSGRSSSMRSSHSSCERPPLGS